MKAGHDADTCRALRACAAGCGSATKNSAPQIDPRAEYQNSLDAYQACVNSNLNNIEACEEKRVQMETNGRAYRNR
jgi:hypothetical protein